MQLPKRYGIGELAKLINVSKTTLLYWSKQGYIPRPNRNDTIRGERWWNEGDAKIIYEYRQTHYQG